MSLSWEYLGKALKAAAEINEADISLLTLQNTTEEKAETILCVEKSLKGAANSTASRAVYENAESDTDIEYRLSGNNVKENIIVKERAEEYKYLFALNTKGLRMRLSDDNMQLELYSETEKEGSNLPFPVRTCTMRKGKAVKTSITNWNPKQTVSTSLP